MKNKYTILSILFFVIAITKVSAQCSATLSQLPEEWLEKPAVTYTVEDEKSADQPVNGDTLIEPEIVEFYDLSGRLVLKATFEEARSKLNGQYIYITKKNKGIILF